jgi:hypothetical protein
MQTRTIENISEEKPKPNRHVVLKIGALLASATAAVTSYVFAENASVVQGSCDFASAKWSEITGDYPQSVDISLDPNDVYTVVPTGDSLADGANGANVETQNGDKEPSSFAYTVVQDLNAREHALLAARYGQTTHATIAQYDRISSLVQIGLTSEGEVEKLEDPSNRQALAKIGNLLLLVSIGGNDARQAFTQSQSIDSWTEAATVVDQLDNRYGSDVQEIIKEVEDIRRDSPGKTVVDLVGLPDVDKSPKIRAEVRGTAAQGNASTIMLMLDGDMAEASINSINNKSGIQVGYVNTYSLPVTSRDVSKNDIHPTDAGYVAEGDQINKTIELSTQDIQRIVLFEP